MMRPFNYVIASLRYLFALAVLALAILAMGSLVRGIITMGDIALTTNFVMEPGSGATVVPYFIRAAFLYFLAVALGSLFVGDIPAPQWMAVKNLFQFRTKVLTFVSIILPLGFMGKMMEADTLTVGTLYSGAGVFMVLMGIFFLVRYGSPSGDEGMAREGNRVPETRSHSDRRQESRSSLDRTRDRQDNRRRDERRQGSKQARSPADQDKWLQKQKEDLKFQKETLEKAVEKDIKGETSEHRTSSHVTVKPGPRRPRGRRR
jgi:uncharacterized membrane protein YqhA